MAQFCGHTSAKAVTALPRTMGDVSFNRVATNWSQLSCSAPSDRLTSLAMALAAHFLTYGDESPAHFLTARS